MKIDLFTFIQTMKIKFKKAEFYSIEWFEINKRI